MNKRTMRIRWLDGSLLVSIALAGCGGNGAAPASPAAVELQRVSLDEAQQLDGPENLIDLLAEVDDGPAAIVLVADSNDSQPLRAPPVSIRSVRSLAEEEAAPAPPSQAPPTQASPARPTAPPVVVHDGSVSSASYRAAAPTSALEPTVGRLQSPAMAAIMQQAEAHTRQGFELANRGAHFSARAEFVHSLRLISQGLDAEQGTSRHGFGAGGRNAGH